MKIDSKKLRLILSAALALSVVGFFAIAFFGLSLLKAKSADMVGLKVKSQTAEAQLSNLEQTKKDIEKYSFFKDVAKTVIPNDKDQAQAVLEINQMAQQSGILIQSITFPASSLGLTTATVSPTTTSATTSSTSAAISQAKPVTGIPGLYSLELTITPQSSDTIPAAQQVTYDKMLNFLGLIENNRHTAQITEVTIQPASDKTSLNFTLTINIFIKP